MPTYRVAVRQDAWLYHCATIEADTKEQAAELALRQWNGDDIGVTFEEGDPIGFDDAECNPEDDVEEIKPGK